MFITPRNSVQETHHDAGFDPIANIVHKTRNMESFIRDASYLNHVMIPYHVIT